MSDEIQPSGSDSPAWQRFARRRSAETARSG